MSRKVMDCAEREAQSTLLSKNSSLWRNSVSQETEAFSKVFELEDWGNFLCNAFSVFSRSSCVQLFATPWMVAHQVPLSMGLFRQEYWRGLPFPSPGDLPDPRTESMSPELAGGFSITEPPRKPLQHYYPISRVHSHPPFQAIFCTVANLFSY